MSSVGARVDIPTIKWIGKWKGLEVMVMDEYYSERDKKWYVFGVVGMKVELIDRSEVERKDKEKSDGDEGSDDNSGGGSDGGSGCPSCTYHY